MKKPKLIVLDVDGVLTNGRKIYDQTGRPIYKQFNDRDFTAIKIFKAMGIKVCFITADKLNMNVAADRNIECFVARDKSNRIMKKEALLEAKKFYNIKDSADVWAVGDDVFDIELFDECGQAFCPADTPKYVAQAAQEVLPLDGGAGVVSALLEFYFTEFILTAKFDMEKLKLLDAKEGWSKK